MTVQTTFCRWRVQLGLKMLGHVFKYAVILPAVDDPDYIVAIVMATDRDEYARLWDTVKQRQVTEQDR